MFSTERQKGVDGDGREGREKLREWKQERRLIRKCCVGEKSIFNKRKIMLYIKKKLTKKSLPNPDMARIKTKRKESDAVLKIFFS